MEFIQTLIDQANNILWGYVMIIALLGCAVYFTLRSRFVQFSMIGEMCRQLVNSTERHLDNGRKHISPFQAFVVSLASRVGTGNLAGVATAIAVGGAGQVAECQGGEAIPHPKGEGAPRTECCHQLGWSPVAM